MDGGNLSDLRHRKIGFVRQSFNPLPPPPARSGGQQQTHPVARDTATNPSLILADEPTGNLDSHSTEDVLRIFARLNEEGRTVVLITHEPDVAEQSKRVIRLSDGQVVEDQRTLAVHEPPPALQTQ